MKNIASLRKVNIAHPYQWCVMDQNCQMTIELFISIGQESNNQIVGLHHLLGREIGIWVSVIAG